jgi:hypothetical protein
MIDHLLTLLKSKKILKMRILVEILSTKNLFIYNLIQYDVILTFRFVTQFIYLLLLFFTKCFIFIYLFIYKTNTT